MTVVLNFKRKIPGQASCKSWQLPRGGRWRRRNEKALLLALSQHSSIEVSTRQTVIAWQGQGREVAPFGERARKPKNVSQACLGKK